MSIKHARSLILLGIFAIIILIGQGAFLALFSTQTDNTNMMISTFEQSVEIKNLYLSVLRSRFDQLLQKSKEDLLELYRDNNYITTYINPIKEYVVVLKKISFSEREQEYVDVIIQTATGYASAVWLSGNLNLKALESAIIQIDNSSGKIQENLQMLTIIQKEILQEKKIQFKKNVAMNNILSFVIIIIILIASGLTAWKLYAQIKLQELQYRTKLDLERTKAAARESKIMLNVQEQLATDIQTSLLPTVQELVDDQFNIAAYMKTADSAGGDYYDYIKKDTDRWFIIGDVTGHGIDSAVVMLMLKFATAMSIQFKDDITPVDVLHLVNSYVTKIKGRLALSGKSKDITKKIATFLVAKIDSNGVGEYAGNHPNMLVYRKKSETVEVLPSHKQFLWIGKLSDSKYETQLPDVIPMTVAPGDKVIFYTDGIIESRVEDKFLNEDGLLDIVANHGGAAPKELIDHINQETEDYLTDDDITMMVVEYNE